MKTVWLVERDCYDDAYIASAWTTLDAARQSLRNDGYVPYGRPEWEAWKKGPRDADEARVIPQEVSE